jgi:hypothetical protein
MKQMLCPVHFSVCMCVNGVGIKVAVALWTLAVLLCIIFYIFTSTPVPIAEHNILLSGSSWWTPDFRKFANGEIIIQPRPGSRKYARLFLFHGSTFSSGFIYPIWRDVHLGDIVLLIVVTCLVWKLLSFEYLVVLLVKGLSKKPFECTASTYHVACKPVCWKPALLPSQRSQRQAQVLQMCVGSPF